MDLTKAALRKSPLIDIMHLCFLILTRGNKGKEKKVRRGMNTELDSSIWDYVVVLDVIAHIAIGLPA